MKNSFALKQDRAGQRTIFWERGMGSNSAEPGRGSKSAGWGDSMENGAWQNREPIKKITVLKTFCAENFTGPESFSSGQGGVGREFLVYLKSTTSLAFTTRWRQVTYFVILDL